MSLCGRELLRLRVFEEEIQNLSLFNKKPKIRKWLEKEVAKMKELEKKSK